MAEYVGMDVSLEEVSICVLNDEGRVLVRGTTSTDPAASDLDLADPCAQGAGHTGHLH
jgi:hypothetical protein